MAFRDMYKVPIRELVAGSGQQGLTTNEIIESISESLPEARAWGIRAALNRMFKAGELAKMFVYEAVGPNPYGRRVYRYFDPANQPADPNVLYSPAKQETL
jgi:hypothetical protein